MSVFRLASLRRSALALALGASMLSAAQGNPCDGNSVPAPSAGGAAAERQPLLRPLMLGGMAVTALQQRDGERWLELAVDSPATAARLLSGRSAGVVRLTQDGRGAVLVACATLDAPTGGTRMAALAQPLW
jgi:hypothetical protein